MYKKDNQGMFIALILSAVLLVLALLLEWRAAIIVMLFAFMVILLRMLFDFQQRLAQIEQQLQLSAQRPNRELSASEQPTGHIVAPAQPVQHSATVQSEPNIPTWMQVDTVVESVKAPPFENPSDTNNTQPTARKAAAWWQPALDWFMHGNPILRVAVAVLMVGVVLLLRFASEQWQLSLGVKLGFIGSAGVITTVVGYWLQRKNQLFAVALQGVGLAVIFLTLIFSYHFAVLVSLTTAAVLFVILLLATVYLSLKQQALYLAMLALGMAYLAPLLIPQDHPDVVFLFGYYLVINLAVAAVNFIQPWKILHQIAFFATMLIGGVMIGIYGKTAQFHSLDTILWLHIALFIWLSIRYSQLMLRAQNQLQTTDKAPRLAPILDVGLIFSVPVLGFSLHAYLMHQSTQALTWGAVVLAVVYIALHVWIKRQHPQLSALSKSFFILAVVFIALIFPLAKGAHWTSSGWVIQGTALIVWGVTERYRLSRYIGVALVLMSSIALLLQVWSNDDFPILSTVIFALAQFISAFYLLHYQEAEKYFSGKMLSGIFLALGMYAGSIAAVEYLHMQQHGLSPYLAIAVLLLVLFSVAVHVKSKLQWRNVQLLLLVGLLFLLYMESFSANVYSQLHWKSTLQQISFLLAAMGITVLLSMLLRHTRVKHIAASLFCLALASIGLAIFPIMPLVALALCPTAYGLGVFFSPNRSLLQQPSIWCLSLLWLLLISFDVHSAVQYYVVPVLNFTDALSLLVLAALLWLLYRHDFQGNKQCEWGFKLSTILMALLVLSSVVVRAMHHYIGTPLWGHAIWHNGEVQLSLTLLWVVLAFILMTFSSRRHIRQVWFVGAALLAIVVAKLLLLDLSQSGTLTRVFSFIGSGVVMLVIAYLAPLPPAIEEVKKE